MLTSWRSLSRFVGYLFIYLFVVDGLPDIILLDLGGVRGKLTWNMLFMTSLILFCRPNIGQNLLFFFFNFCQLGEGLGSSIWFNLLLLLWKANKSPAIPNSKNQIKFSRQQNACFIFLFSNQVAAEQDFILFWNFLFTLLIPLSSGGGDGGDNSHNFKNGWSNSNWKKQISYI